MGVRLGGGGAGALLCLGALLGGAGALLCLAGWCTALTTLSHSSPPSGQSKPLPSCIPNLPSHTRRTWKDNPKDNIDMEHREMKRVQPFFWLLLTRRPVDEGWVFVEKRSMLGGNTSSRRAFTPTPRLSHQQPIWRIHQRPCLQPYFLPRKIYITEKSCNYCNYAFSI